MKQPRLLTLCGSLLATAAFAQADAFFPVEAVIEAPYTVMTVEEAALRSADDVADLQLRYPAQWMREYETVELTTQVAGEPVTTSGTTARLSPAQRAALAAHDAAVPVQVAVTYVPENDLHDNPARTYAFTSAVSPAQAPAFPGGEAALQAYLQSALLDQLPAGTFDIYQLAAVRFTLDAEGCVTAAELVEPTNNAAADRVLLDAVRAMPDWTPAAYANGTPAAVARVLAVGDLRSCTANLVGLPPREE